MPVRSVPVQVVATPEPVKPKVEPKSLDWNFGPKELPNVQVAIAAAIAKNSVRTEVKTPAPKPAPRPQVPVRTANLHSHQCGRCGAIFSHDNTNHGNAQAHMCPQCGFGPNYRIMGR